MNVSKKENFILPKFHSFLCVENIFPGISEKSEFGKAKFKTFLCVLDDAIVLTGNIIKTSDPINYKFDP